MTLAIGIMSGTSVDAIDGVLLESDDTDSVRLLDKVSRPFPGDIRQSIIQLMQPGDNEIDVAGALHTELAILYASVATDLVPAGKTVDVIGCHGQTVRHRPDGEFPFTFQLGNGAMIAQQTGIPTVTDFRSADIAAGGQGAPFAPFFHHHVFASPTAARAIVNLGGIANATILPADESLPVTGFDTGPANCLMDSWIMRHQGMRFDANGDWAASGVVDRGLLQRLLDDPYFHRPAPKSTGREYFNDSWLEAYLEGCREPLHPVNVQATLAMLTTESIVKQLPAFVDEIYLCGGGSANQNLRKLLANSSGLPVQDTAALGIDPQWIEAAAFAWMALSTLHRKPSTVPSVTGAAHSTVAGAIYFP